ncbi:MAG: hypothetical protein L7U87_00105 [Chlamydiales bacterium]|nr:hypothetical protein [Chlamydiales bacterium]
MKEEDFKTLIEIILDPEAREDEKDDAAFYLTESGEQRALPSLLYASLHPSENDLEVLSDYGEAIGALWIKRNQFDMEGFLKLPRKTRSGICAVLEFSNPVWMKEYDLIRRGFGD